MTKFLISLSAVTLLTNVASASQPTLLSDKQMDRVSAGIQVQSSSFNPSPFQSSGATFNASPFQFSGATFNASPFQSSGASFNP